MSLTLNQIKTRLISLAGSHRQIKTVRFVGLDESLDDSDLLYPACIIELQEGNRLALSERLVIYNFKIYFFDLLNIAKDSMSNEYDVKSDLSSIAQDFHAMLNFSEYAIGENSWAVSEDCQMNITTFELQDLCAGVELTLSIGARYDANRCQVPADDITFETDNNMKIINNYIHEVEEEASELTLTSLINKEILMFFLGTSPLTPTTSTPTADQYRYTASTGRFEFGTIIQKQQIIQILNRNL